MHCLADASCSAPSVLPVWAPEFAGAKWPLATSLPGISAGRARSILGDCARSRAAGDRASGREVVQRATKAALGFAHCFRDGGVRRRAERDDAPVTVALDSPTGGLEVAGAGLRRLRECAIALGHGRLRARVTPLSRTFVPP